MSGMSSNFAQGRNTVEQHKVDELEAACERALAEALRQYYSTSIQPRVCHLMAKAAVAVLEAVIEAEARK
jgi:hypothetical protein